MAVSLVELADETVGLLSNIGDDVFDHPVRADYLKAFIDDPRHVMILAVEGGVVVGMASGVEYFHPDKPPQMWINEVGVAPSHRRRGIGRDLTHALVKAAAARGCIFAWLGTDQSNNAAQACFASVEGVEPPQPFLLYEWDLED
ncbi:MAG: GNAT family N-acetyltransferase [Hyphomonas sp.]